VIKGIASGEINRDYTPEELERVLVKTSFSKFM
jgi:hypothetical protein